MAHDFHHRNPSKRFNAQYSIISIFFFSFYFAVACVVRFCCVCVREFVDWMGCDCHSSVQWQFAILGPHRRMWCIPVLLYVLAVCIGVAMAYWLPPPQFAITTIRITCHTRPPSARPSQTCAICADYVCRVWCPTIDFIIEQRWLSLTHDWRGCSSKNVTQMPWWTRWQ